MTIEKYIPAGTPSGEAYEAISDMMREVDVGKSYADMIRYRLSGAASDVCADTYYVAIESKKSLSRLWMGWGKHPDAIGNWGNFYTNEKLRGRGIGKKMLGFWHEDMARREDLPLCLLCSAGTKALADMYAAFGFVCAIEGKEFGPLYLPLGDSPAKFKDFYDAYYKPSDALYLRSASVEYRHEIDCLLRFVYIDMGLDFGIGDMLSVESALLYAPERCGMLFSEDGHAVGWSFDGKMQIHPLYKDAKIVLDQ